MVIIICNLTREKERKKMNYAKKLKRRNRNGTKLFNTKKKIGKSDGE